ncbi:hypothetical protein [Trichocoleus sp. FACHB-262]|uniref:hypothetical protein n=1 Tax=Trichocoleus sp. FACHB-262 TaxID=2692869 RepID=UPI001689D2E6|nr:hypothetical protein [Trichocoleus sp. FACHB-262]MBD2124629.1 hypothetical protein [Trichocoleus sp. FACHB-262]
MPEFYQTHLRSCLSRAQFLLLLLVIQLLPTLKSIKLESLAANLPIPIQSESRLLLPTLKSIKLESLAANLPIPIQSESRLRKLKRFLSSSELSFERLWHPILIEQLHKIHAPGASIYVALDRTQWKQTNLLVLIPLLSLAKNNK